MRRTTLLSLAFGTVLTLLMVATVYSAVAGPRENGSALNGTITEQEAHQAVWDLPEVRQRAEQLRRSGVRPFTMTWVAAEPGAEPGTDEASYTIYFGEDHQSHTAHLETFAVDAYTGQIRAITGRSGYQPRAIHSPR